MPAEAGHHTATWMAYGATAQAWGTRGVYGASRLVARKDLMRIAANVSRFEPVKVLISNLGDQRQAMRFLDEVRRETPTFAGLTQLPAVESAGAIQFLLCPLDDLWIRDTGPVFVCDDQHRLFGVDLNFNGWGQEDTGVAGWQKDREKAKYGVVDQPVAKDRKIAQFVMKQSGAVPLRTGLVMEGGSIEVDGYGTAICTESSILNANRNPGCTKEDVERELLRLFGVRKVIWLPGLRSRDITDGHVDFYARFVGEATVVYSLENDPGNLDYASTQHNRHILSEATDARGNKLRTVALVSPRALTVRASVEARNGWDRGRSWFNAEGFAAGYVGFYATQACVVVAKFGDKSADEAALEVVRDAHPNRAVIQIYTDGLANGGGTIHCATQQQPWPCPCSTNPITERIRQPGIAELRTSFSRTSWG
ncbi:agmatine deiminase family protein [Cupriavidus necator]